jgi:hypothetical protein
MPDLCSDRTKLGEPCRARALPGREKCFHHDPSREGARMRRNTLGGLSRRLRPNPDAKAVVLDTVEACHAETERIVSLLNSGRMDVNRYTAHLKGIELAMKIIEARHLEARLAALAALEEGN